MKDKMLLRLMVSVLLSALFLLPSCGEKPTDAPLPTPKALVWAIGAPLPAATDFFDAIPEGDTVSYAEKNPFDALQMGENAVALSYQPKEGKAQRLNATMTLIEDTTPPVIAGARDLLAYVGDLGVAYYAGVTTTDNCGGRITLKADSSAVDLTREGVYPVTYYAVDHAGNRAIHEIYLHVYKEEITPDRLYAVLDPLIEELGLRTMTKEQQARVIFRFVHTDAKITYVDTSDKTDWIREAYFCLQNRKGDCFSYFAVSKAFFERLGIENLDVQRLPGFTDDTHYWSMINIAEEGAEPLWYHYDATRLRDVIYSGALLTDAQVDAFSQQRAYFYHYDRSKYPATSTVTITERPDLT